MKKFIILFLVFFLASSLIGCTQKINGVPVADEKVFDNINNRDFWGQEYVFRGCLNINEDCIFVDPLLNYHCTIDSPQFCCYVLKNYDTHLMINMAKISEEQKKGLIENSSLGNYKYYVQIKGVIGIGSYRDQWNVEAEEMEILSDCKPELLKSDTGDYSIREQQNTKPSFQMESNVNLK
ncbi:MAG TPA: hypothetical protein ENN28_00450 [Candidatus Uhrbacteria bacterium]|nr:hypothetical protein [Candidatus Uhrbacteria bacterium]